MDANIELILKYREGDRKACDTLVEKNTGLIWSIVKRFQNRGYEKEELYQIGAIGLIKAIEKFDISFDVKFSTYAVPMIMGEIRRFLRDDGIIKVSRTIKELSMKYIGAKEKLSKEFGREPTINEVANDLNVGYEELVVAIESINATESLYGSEDSEGRNPIDVIDGDAQKGESDLIDKIALREMLKQLEPREKQIIVLRYYKEQTQEQIAKVLGISQVQVSRIEKKIIGELRKKIV